MQLHKQQRKVDSLKGQYSEDVISEFEKQMQQTYDDQLKRITEMVPYPLHPCLLILTILINLMSFNIFLS